MLRFIKIIKITLLISLLSGCATNQFNSQSIHNIKNEKQLEVNLPDLAIDAYSQTSFRYTDLPKITINTYKDILKNKKNSVYQHPFYPNQVITLILGEDDSVFQELERLGLKDSFNSQTKKWKGFNSYYGEMVTGVHFISQNEEEYDANVIILNPRRNRFGDYNAHHSYMLLMHETAHSLHSQYEYAMEYGSTLLLENYSDIVASIMTYQLIMNEGYDMDYYLRFLRDNKKRAHSLASSVHQTQQTFDVMSYSIKNNPDLFLDMSLPEIESFGFNMAKEILDEYFPKNK